MLIDELIVKGEEGGEKEDIQREGLMYMAEKIFKRALNVIP